MGTKLEDLLAKATDLGEAKAVQQASDASEKDATSAKQAADAALATAQQNHVDATANTAAKAEALKAAVDAFADEDDAT